MTNQYSDHIQFSFESGLSGITYEDEQIWKRRYDHIRDLEIILAEFENCHGVYSINGSPSLYNPNVGAHPRAYLECWMSGDWWRLSRNMATVYWVCTPYELNQYISEYFRFRFLIESLALGRKSGFADSVGLDHYTRAYGYALRLRAHVDGLPRIPNAIGKADIDLRQLQNWCFECGKVTGQLRARIGKEDTRKPLQILRQLKAAMDSPLPEINRSERREIENEIVSLGWIVFDAIQKADMPIDYPNVCCSSSNSNAEIWFTLAANNKDCTPLLQVLQEKGVEREYDPHDLALLINWADSYGMLYDLQEYYGRKPVEAKLESDRHLVRHLYEPSCVSPGGATVGNVLIPKVIKAYQDVNEEYKSAILNVQSQISTYSRDLAAAINSSDTLRQFCSLVGGDLMLASKGIEHEWRMRDGSPLSVDAVAVERGHATGNKIDFRRTILRATLYMKRLHNSNVIKSGDLPEGNSARKQNKKPKTANEAKPSKASNSASAAPPDAIESTLTGTEENLLEALGNNTMTGTKLLKKAGYDNSSHYRGTLSNLVKRCILANNGKGYFRPMPDNVSDQCQ